MQSRKLSSNAYGTNFYLLKHYYTSLLIATIILGACTSDKKEASQETPAKTSVVVPPFNADSAYQYIQTQVDFGPRVPNSEAHNRTGNYLVQQMTEFGWQVTEQNFEATSFDNQRLYLRNIIASYNPQVGKRILLAAHWDGRPFADKDNERQNEPIDAANDGASGVGVLLEIARTIAKNDSLENIGVDIIFFDGEDWGNDGKAHGHVPLRDGWESWWALGSQYWSKNLHKPRYSAFYGILLDMVGGKNAQFWIEGHSNRSAPSIVNKVWSQAEDLGYGQYFKRKNGAEITDDHYFVNKNTGIPMIDIIPTDPIDGSFGSFHHTHDDNMSIISKETLKAVGETVLHVVYHEQQ